MFRDFVCACRPRSANNSDHGFKDIVLEAYQASEPNLDIFPKNCHFYGMVYYFVRDYNPNTHVDADNLSKKVWDGLETAVYEDDKAVRFRCSGIIETGQKPTGLSWSDIDLDGMSDLALEVLTGHISRKEKHILYIRLGVLKPEMFNLPSA